MKVLVTLVVSGLALVGSASATNIALGKTPTSCSTTTDSCSIPGFGASLAVDGNANTPSLWVAPNSTAQPYLLVNLGSVVTNVANVVIQGTGNANLFSAFDVFVSATAPNAATNLDTLAHVQAWGTLVLNEPNQTDSASVWTDTSGFLGGTSIQYVLYYALNGTDGGRNTGCPTTPCTPGNSNGVISGQDDAFVNELQVNTTPEPATFGLLGFALLGLGFARRRRS